MSRGQGRIYRQANSDVWWLDYSVGRRRHRESSGMVRRSDAAELLRQRIGQRTDGRLVGRPDRVLLAEYAKDAEGKEKLVGGLRWLHETQYDLDGLRSKDRIRQCWNRLERFFGPATRVTDVTPLRLDAYATARLAEGAARQTVNTELSALRRAFNLAQKKGLLATVPRVELAKVENAREGFFEDDDFAAVLLELPPYARAVITFLRVTGWRVMEALGLTWDRVDWERHGLRLSARQTKGKQARLFPFGLVPDLKALLDAAWAEREGVFVFQRHGRPVGYTTLLHHWQRATKRAGCEARLIHDLRRTAARDFRMAGVDEDTIMALCGWRTRAMFDRYNIINDADLAAAVAKRYGIVAAYNSTTTAPA